MDSSLSSAPSPQSVTKWKSIVREFQIPHLGRAVWQLINSVGAYAALWAVMYFTHTVSWWLTVPLAILAGAILVRVFIIFHDCTHGSFFKSKRANDFWGFITGMLTFTPYHHWRWEHNLHHASAGDLDRRGVGDIWTMTVEEYLKASPKLRFLYRFSRNPFVLLLLSPLFLFFIMHRIPLAKSKPREKRSVWLMNLAIAAMCGTLIFFFGFWPWLILQVLTMGVAGGAGIWLFYVQHQFEDVYWERGEEWDYTAAAMEGSSFYKLPKVLQWFSGNIGYHHIHHLSPRIPNYNLERCHNSDSMFQDIKPLTIPGSLKALHYRLWDEKGKRLISFGQLRQMLQRKDRGGYGRLGLQA
ncbi:MAG: fatty acid desaturase [Verrucomicrobiota bacterium]